MQQKDRENPAKFTQANFKTYTMTFNLNENNQTQNYAKSIVNLTAKELKSEMKTFAAEKIDITSLKVQYYQRITLAFACFTFVLLASSLAGLGTKHKKSIAFGISLILLFIFYILLALGSSLAEKKILPASIGLLLPNFCLGIVAIYLGIKSNKN